MRIGRAEAMDLFRKWLSERALLRCDFLLSEFAACFRGRIVSLSAERGKMLSDDTFCELDFPLAPTLEFGYGEPRDFAERREFAGALVAFFPKREGETEAGEVCFLEISE